ncbi:MAG: translocation/assembly module TamB [Candidatus Krumholzibacteriota bacterium]|nr:translocation/assembly module TamB [Candidatus Krumholzibacteriota bacterium]
MNQRPRRILLRAAAGLGIALAAVLLAAVLALQLRPAREALLDAGLRRAQTKLPGRLAAGEATWASPGRLDLSDIAWTAAGDTLLAARRFAVDLDLSALLRRDLHLRRLEAADLRLDLPAIARHRGAAPGGGPATGGVRVPWLRAGALPGLPSLAADTLRASASRLQLTDSLALAGLVLDTSAELRAGRAPRFHVRDLRLGAGPGGARVDSASAFLDLATGVVAGNAAGAVLPVGLWRLELTGPAPDSFALALHLGPGAAGPPGQRGAPTLAARARLGRGDGDAVRRLDWTAELAAPDSALLARLPAGLRRLPPLRGRLAEAAGSVRLPPGTGGEASLRALPQSWLAGGDIALSWGRNHLRVDSLRLAAAGLALAGHGSVAADSARADLSLDAAGSDLFALLAPAVEPPGSLTAAVRLHLDGPRASPALSARLRGRTTWPLPVDSLTLDVSCPALGASPLHADLMLGAVALVLDASAALAPGALAPGDTLNLAVDPLRLRRAGSPPFGAPGPPGRLRWHRWTGAFEASHLRLAGALGDWELGAAGDRTAARFTASGSWPEPPAILAAWLPGGAETLAALAAGWDRECGLAVDGTLAAGAGAPDVAARVRLHLPGPRALGALLPAGADVADLGPLLGDLSLAVRGGGEPRLQLAADLGATAWLDTARADLTGRGADLRLDTLALAGLGLRLTAAGSLDEASRDLRARLAVSDLALARRFLRDLDPAWQGRLDAQVAIAGTNAAPRLRAELTGEAAGPGLSLPALNGRLRWTADSLAAQLSAPAGADAGVLALDSLRLDYTAGAGPLPGRLVLSLTGPDLSWHHHLTLSRPAAWELRSDSLRLSLRGRSLASRSPFRITLDPKAGSWRVDDLAMRGSLGSLSAQGGASKDAADLAVRLDLAPPPSLRPPGLHAGWWPARAAAELHLPAADSLNATLRLEGLKPVRGLEAVASLSALQGPQGLRGSLSVDGNGAVLCGADLAAPALLPLPGARPPADGTFVLDLRFDGLPLPLLTPASRGVPAADAVFRLDGGVQAEGGLAAPSARANLALGFPSRDRLDRYRMTVEVSQDAPAGLRAAFALLREEERRLRGTLVLPLAASLRPARVGVAAADTLDLELASEELRLRDLSPLLPGRLGMEGRCRLSLAARGPAGDPALAGTIALRDTRLQMTGGSHLALDGTLNATGTARRPRVAGSLAVKSGVLRLASVERRLHPCDPPSRLRAAGFGAADTLAAAPPPRAAGLDSLALDVTLDIPGGLWLKGPGLEVELTGALQVDQSGGLPRLTGSLEARRGTLELLGRRFRMESGKVHFYGGEELDPTLDLELSTQLEGATILVAMGGTAHSPKLNLSSTPPMSEGDIMAFLVFGRRLDELNDDQVTLLQERGTEAATSLGVTALEDRLSRQIGLDVLSFHRDGEEGDRAVTVGKYLSPRVLLKYQQSLEEAGAFILNFEYFLPKRLRLETTLGQRSPSGAAINWAYDF